MGVTHLSGSRPPNWLGERGKCQQASRGSPFERSGHAHAGEELDTLLWHTMGMTGCAINPLGDTIVSASYDQTLKV
jgi:hypothetical protein